MAVDDSFKKPGAIPFKWEIRPGVPKVQTQQPKQHRRQAFDDCKNSQKEKSDINGGSGAFPGNSSTTPTKLAPPPAGFYFQQQPPLMEPRTRSSLSAPRTRSERYRLYTSALAQPESVYSGGCLPSSPLLIGRNNDKKKMNKDKIKLELESEPDCSLDLETLSRWSDSSRKSLSPFRDSSSLSSSFSSHRSPPRPVNDAEWAGFGLF